MKIETNNRGKSSVTFFKQSTGILVPVSHKKVPFLLLFPKNPCTVFLPEQIPIRSMDNSARLESILRPHSDDINDLFVGLRETNQIK